MFVDADWESLKTVEEWSLWLFVGVSGFDVQGVVAKWVGVVSKGASGGSFV